MAPLAQNLARAATLLLLGLLLIAAAVWMWLGTKEVSQDTALAVSVFLAGLAAAACFGGTMHFLDRPLENSVSSPWHIRWPLVAVKRMVFFGQLAVSAAAVFAVFILIFGNMPAKTRWFSVPRPGEAWPQTQPQSDPANES